jgi:protein-disulfide isomerase
VLQTLGGHEGSCEAAAAVRMARDRGKDGQMIAWLFDNQDRLIQMALGSTLAANASSNAIKAQAVTMLGIKPEDFDREYAAKLTDIRRDESDGQALGVGSTPTYFVNGIRTTDAKGNNLPPPYFELGIKIEIEKPAGK